MTKLYCIACPKGCLMTVTGGGSGLVVDGASCQDGIDFAEAEFKDPVRVLTTTVRTNFPDVPVISVRTDGEIPRNKISQALEELNEIIVSEELGCGDTLLEDVAETGVSVIVTGYALSQLGAELENKNVQLSRSGASASDADYDASYVVRNSVTGEVLDDIGADAEAVGGVVGAAGEAVGVADGEEADNADDAAAEKDDDSGRPRGRARISR